MWFLLGVNETGIQDLVHLSRGNEDINLTEPSFEGEKNYETSGIR